MNSLFTPGGTTKKRPLPQPNGRGSFGFTSCVCSRFGPHCRTRVPAGSPGTRFTKNGVLGWKSKNSGIVK